MASTNLFDEEPVYEDHKTGRLTKASLSAELRKIREAIWGDGEGAADNLYQDAPDE